MSRVGRRGAAATETWWSVRLPRQYRDRVFVEVSEIRANNRERQRRHRERLKRLRNNGRGEESEAAEEDRKDPALLAAMPPPPSPPPPQRQPQHVEPYQHMEPHLQHPAGGNAGLPPAVGLPSSYRHPGTLAALGDHRTMSGKRARFEEPLP